MDETTEAVRTYPTDGRSGADVAKREPQVHSELAQTEAAIEQLGLAVEALDGRLRCVSRPESDGATLATAGRDDALVTVAERTRGLRYTVDANTQRLRSLLDRLEV